MPNYRNPSDLVCFNLRMGCYVFLTGYKGVYTGQGLREESVRGQREISSPKDKGKEVMGS